MKVAFVNTSDSAGGAARAASRLLRGIQERGHACEFHVQENLKKENSVLAYPLFGGRGTHVARFSLDKMLLRVLHVGLKPSFSLAWLPSRLPASIHRAAPDLVHLHWINSGFVAIETLRNFKVPLIWTLHDMWAFTGGCLYTDSCDRYKTGCGKCPQLKSNRDRDLSRWVWERKQKAWKNVTLTIVTPSQWLARCAKESPLLSHCRIEVIPNGLDLNVYRPHDRDMARDSFRLPRDKKLILFGAMHATSDPRKGYALLVRALAVLKETGWEDRCEVVVFGATTGDAADFGLKAHFLGTLNDEEDIVKAYSAADVFVAPSVQENLANTVVESLACGTPCVAFDIGGMPDMIDSGENGFLATPLDPTDLAKSIIKSIAEDAVLQQLSIAARKKAEDVYSLDAVAARYEALYQEVIDQ